ncbi:MAG: IS1595 family transposase [Phyllobacteriaceae bacterium]|nr:IS1595 family transposase [Phyllobacteriaceae bacterium]
MKRSITIAEFNTRFPDDDVCLEHLMRTRYGDRHECPSCGKSAHYYRVKSRRSYECEYCGKQVYPTAGTPFEATRTPLKSWFFVMFLFTTSRNGVSAKEVERTIGVTYKTAWRMCNLIRQYMGYLDGDSPLGGPGRGIVEADKAFIGGKDKQGHDDKAIVLGMVERGYDVVTRVIPSRRANAVMPAVYQTVRPNTRLATDEALAFREAGETYRHATVNHAKKVWVAGPGNEVHTNNIEAFWGNVKRSISGTYVWVSKKYLQTYLWEFEFRYNWRKSPYAMFETMIGGFQKAV